MNQTPATASAKSRAMAAGWPFMSRGSEKTNRKGMTNNVQPNAIATQPVLFASAPARLAATNAAIATGGEIIDKQPQYMMNMCAAMGSMPILTSAAPTNVASTT